MATIVANRLVFALYPITQGDVVDKEFFGHFPDWNRAFMTRVIVNGIRKSLLTFSSRNSHNKRCGFIVILLMMHLQLWKYEKGVLKNPV
jgi:hypothetical protein